MSEEKEEHTEDSNQVPEEDARYFKRLFRLTSNSVARLVIEAEQYQALINESKTKPKKDLYTKKFNKVRAKFLDEVGRLHQIKHILDENNISLDDEEQEEEDN